MTSFDATLFDGRNAARWPVRITADGADVVVTGEFEALRIPRAAIVPDAPVPGVPRMLQLRGGGAIETADHAAVEVLWPAQSALARFAFRMESSWRAAAGAVALIAVATAFIVVVLLPRAADDVAARISPDLERAIGKHAFESMDEGWLKPTTLPEAQREALTRKFTALIADDPDGRDYRLVFRSGPGPNAFALPGGIVVVTDDMVKLAQDDAQLLAVLAHELGHVRGRHALRLLLRQSGVFVLVTALAGDAVGMTILAAALPTLLLESSYSRQFEADADDFAFDHLKRHGYSPQAFADVMRRLQAAEKSSSSDERFFRYLSSHPVTDERIERAEAAAR